MSVKMFQYNQILAFYRSGVDLDPKNTVRIRVSVEMDAASPLYNPTMELRNAILEGRWEDVLPSAPSGSVSLVVMDPPYGAIPAIWDRRPDWILLMSELGRVCGDTGQYWCFVRMPWAMDVYSAAIANGWQWVQEVIWEKQNAGGCTVGTFRKVHENIWHFKRKCARTFNLEAVRVPKITSGDKSVRRRKDSTTQFLGANNSAYCDDGMRLPRSVIRCRNIHRSKESLGHPTQKPLGIVIPLVLYSSNPGDLILDPFCGTGTSLVAAKMHSRRWLGVESDPKWLKVARDRLDSTAVLELGTSEEPQGETDLFAE